MYILKFKGRANFGRHAAVIQMFMYQILWLVHNIQTVLSLLRGHRQILWVVLV